MTQTLAIFRKDVRLLRLPIALSIGMTTVFAASYSVRDGEMAHWPVVMLLVLAWWGLAAAAILHERPAGENQFWTTRPYRPSSLIAAKTLFLAAFIHLPLLTADLAILASQRFTPSWSALLVRQLGAAALVTLPASALAALTTSFGAMAGASIGVLAASIALLMILDTARKVGLFDEWLRGALILTFLLLAGVATVVWQYRRRHTTVAIGIATGGFALAIVAAATPFAIPVVPAVEPLSLRSIRVVAEPRSATNPGIHLHIEGVPDGMRPAADAIAVQYRGDGVPWNSGWRPHFGPQSPPVSWNSDGDPARIDIYPYPAGERGRFHVSVLVSLYGRITTELLPADRRPHDSAIGRCEIDSRADFLAYTCRNSHYPLDLFEFHGVRVLTRPGLYFEYLSAGPIVRFGGATSRAHEPHAPVTLRTAPLIGQVRREIEIRLEPPR